MPEGDTIWRTAAALRRRIGGRVVSDARPTSIARLKGRKLESVEPNGKHLVMQFEGGLALHSHMRMTGAWHLYRVGERWRQPERRATAVLSFDDVVAVCFAAPIMELVRDARQPVSHLGPDILVDPFDIDEVIRRARISEASTLGELLLEQRVCAGIGNIYKCESLWGLRLDPWMRPNELDDEPLLEGPRVDAPQPRDADRPPAPCGPWQGRTTLSTLRDADSNPSPGAPGSPHLFLPAVPGRSEPAVDWNRNAGDRSRVLAA